jgi:hypothetical protein
MTSDEKQMLQRLASARHSEAKQAVFELECILADVHLKLTRAREAADRANFDYLEICRR